MNTHDARRALTAIIGARAANQQAVTLLSAFAKAVLPPPDDMRRDALAALIDALEAMQAVAPHLARRTASAPQYGLSREKIAHLHAVFGPQLARQIIEANA